VFSDFQCPHCRDYYLGTIRPLLQEYSSKDKVCVIYHEFPLPGHPYAREAARYTEAAAQLGQQKLLPVYDSIFTNQAQWSEDGKLEATVAKALPQDDFLKVKKAMQDPSINAAIEKEIQLGVQNKVDSTPTSLIYYIGRQERVDRAIAYPVLKQFIDSIVK
jgi:protein-disulfide isomerase